MSSSGQTKQTDAMKAAQKEREKAAAKAKAKGGHKGEDQNAKNGPYEKYKKAGGK